MLLNWIAAMTSNSIAQTVSPDIQSKLEIARDDCAELRRLLEEFSNMEDFELKDIGQHFRFQDGGQMFYVVLNKNDETEVLLTDFLENDAIRIAFYELKPSPDFDRTVQNLTDRIGERWPGRVSPYSDGS